MTELSVPIFCLTAIFPGHLELELNRRFAVVDHSDKTAICSVFITHHCPTERPSIKYIVRFLTAHDSIDDALAQLVLSTGYATKPLPYHIRPHLVKASNGITSFGDCLIFTLFVPYHPITSEPRWTKRD